MKRTLGVLLVSALVGGCVVVPVGRYYDDNDGYRLRGHQYTDAAGACSMRSSGVTNSSSGLPG